LRDSQNTSTHLELLDLGAVKNLAFDHSGLVMGSLANKATSPRS
jgi:hypothetical protein